MAVPRVRGNGDGSVYLVPWRRRPWAASVVTGWTPSGKPKRETRYSDTKEGAERLLAQMVAGHIPPPMLAKRRMPESAIRPRAERRRSDRKPIAPRLRFQVLQRDAFSCVYCGRHASPEVKLVVDHIVAHAKGGADSIDNYATACFDCNAGKSDLDISA